LPILDKHRLPQPGPAAGDAEIPTQLSDAKAPFIRDIRVFPKASRKSAAGVTSRCAVA